MGIVEKIGEEDEWRTYMCSIYCLVVICLSFNVFNVRGLQYSKFEHNPLLYHKETSIASTHQICLKV
jgi:hypothetical protein